MSPWLAPALALAASAQSTPSTLLHDHLSRGVGSSAQGRRRALTCRRPVRGASRYVAASAATAPPATTSAMGTGAPSGPRPTSGVTRTPPPNMQAPSTADAEPAAAAPLHAEHRGVGRHQAPGGDHDEQRQQHRDEAERRPGTASTRTHRGNRSTRRAPTTSSRRTGKRRTSRALSSPSTTMPAALSREHQAELRRGQPVDAPAARTRSRRCSRTARRRRTRRSARSRRTPGRAQAGERPPGLPQAAGVPLARPAASPGPPARSPPPAPALITASR